MVYVHQPIYGYAQFFGPKRQLVKFIFLKIINLFPHFYQVHCPTCNQNTKTTIKYVNGRNTWSESIAIALFGLLF